ncbi:MAG: hypothetical protein GXO55_07075 [Chloroflexi bacterium]|nr:hypothetical protein [Chloroflexota bacterium]
MERRFYVLRVVSLLFKVFAFLLLIVGLASLVFALVRIVGGGGNGDFGHWAQIGGAVLLFGWAFGEFMVLYAIGESLNVLMAIEENTRASSLRLSHLAALITRAENIAEE